jgi:hypothetical protein
MRLQLLKHIELKLKVSKYNGQVKNGNSSLHQHFQTAVTNVKVNESLY